jgi:hypothetical protein
VIFLALFSSRTVSTRRARFAGENPDRGKPAGGVSGLYGGQRLGFGSRASVAVVAVVTPLRTAG